MRCADRAMGFCLFNNIAIAACVARDEHGLDRVLIVDWDVHHGNGTQDMFYADGRVGFLLDPPLAVLSGHWRRRRNRHRRRAGRNASICPSTFGTPRATYRDRFAARARKVCRADPAATCAGQRRLRQPPRRPDRLAWAGDGRLRRADEARARRGRTSTPAAASSASWKAATTRRCWRSAWRRICGD